MAANFAKYIPITVSRVSQFHVPRNPFRNRQFTSTLISGDGDETLNQIVASISGPSVSTEEICINHIQNLCATGNYLTASKLPQALRGKHIFLTPRAYNYLLEAAVSMNDIDLLCVMFKDLLVSCGSIRLNSYLILARAFGKRNDSGVLLSFVKEISDMGLVRNDVVLNRLIFALAKCGFVDYSLLVFDCMKGLKCKPDLVTYNTVLAILGRLGRVDEMLNVFACMKTDKMVPDIFTYNTVLNSLRKMGRLDLCLVHYKEMSERGIQPDLLTFKALIESLGRSGDIDGALSIFDEMKCKRICPSVHIYRALVFSLKKMGKVELALQFSAEMNKLFRNSVIPRDFQYKNR